MTRVWRRQNRLVLIGLLLLCFGAFLLALGGPAVP